MLRSISKLMLLAALVVVVAAPGGATQEYDDDQPIYYSDRARVDRYLDAEVWTNHADGEYYTGDNITIHFRTSRDAFVAIYSVDTRGRVNLLFPSSPDDDNFVYGGETYRIPGGNWDYDLVVSGPEGIENIQIIASRERFPIPNWYNNSGIVADWDDRYEFMDYLNGRYFVRYDGQRFAFDRAVIFVNEWEPTYYRPIYRPYYPSWSVTGNFYVDYGWGHSVYINGVYWGCTPLYVPRIAVGWHTVTIYDSYGHCWERPVHFSHYNTVVLNRTVVQTSPTVKSKFKEVRQAGYRDPVKAGYKNFTVQPSSRSVTKSSTTVTNKNLVQSRGSAGSVNSYKYARGSTKLVKTSRGYETDHSTVSAQKRGKTARTANGPSGYDRYKSRQDASSAYKSRSGNSSRSANSASGYYQKKSNGSNAGRSTGNTYRSKRSSSESSRSTVKSSTGSKRSSGAYRSKGSSNRSSGTIQKRSSGSSKKSSGTIKRSSGSSKSSGSYRKSSGGAKKSSGTVTSSGSRKSSGASKKSSGSSKSKGKSKK